MTTTPFYRLTTDELIAVSQFGDAPALVYLYLATRSDHAGECFPSLTTIAKQLGMDRQRVIRAIAKLKDAGWLSVEGDAGLVNTYVLTPPDQYQKPTGGSIKNRPGDQYQKPTDTRSVFDTPPVSKTDHELDTRTRTKNQKVVVPEILDTEAFRIAWSEWEQYRTEIGKKLTDTTRLRQFRTLAAWGPEKAIRAIETAIEKGWRGLFQPDERVAPKANGNGQAKPPQYEPLQAPVPGVRKGAPL